MNKLVRFIEEEYMLDPQGYDWAWQHKMNKLPVNAADYVDDTLIWLDDTLVRDDRQ